MHEVLITMSATSHWHCLGAAKEGVSGLYKSVLAMLGPTFSVYASGTPCLTMQVHHELHRLTWG